MFVLPQPAGYFEKFLAGQGGTIIGFRAEGNLVGQIVLMGPMTLEEAIDKNAITRSEVTFHHANPSEPVVIAKSMAVHPDWQGNGLSQHLLQTALAQPMARAADHVFAQVSAGNMRSWELFLRNGFGIVAAGLDPGDGQPRFVLQKPASGFALYPMASADDVDPVKDFSSIMRLTQREGLIGRPEAMTMGPISGLAFYAHAEGAASWSDKTAVTGNGGQV
jgi:GNAT superfamily N-acetyltransferase